MSYRLSNAAERLKGQPMFKLLSQIQEKEREGIRVIHFEIGDPDFTTPAHIINSACEALKHGRTHYTDSMGLYEFREIIADNNQRTRGFKPNIEQVLAAPGANILIWYAVQCLVNPGDEVIVQDPCFPTYDAVFALCGVRKISVPLREENHFHLMPDDLKKAVTSRTRMVIINSPHNPTGAVMTPEELRKIAEFCIARKIYLYSDEVYSRMNYGDIPFYSPSMIDHCKEYVILANGFSKAFAMTGWRLGVCIAPEDVAAKMGLLLQTTSSCVSEFIQAGGIAAISGSQDEVKAMMNAYRRRRELLVSGLNTLKGVSCLMPEGAFYVFPNITGTGLTSTEFALRALNEAHVGLLPGNDFGSSGEGFIRLCYASSEENIIEGIRRLKAFTDKLAEEGNELS